MHSTLLKCILSQYELKGSISAKEVMEILEDMNCLILPSSYLDRGFNLSLKLYHPLFVEYPRFCHLHYGGYPDLNRICRGNGQTYKRDEVLYGAVKSLLQPLPLICLSKAKPETLEFLSDRQNSKETIRQFCQFVVSCREQPGAWERHEIQYLMHGVF